MATSGRFASVFTIQSIMNSLDQNWMLV